MGGGAREFFSLRSVKKMEESVPHFFGGRGKLGHLVAAARLHGPSQAFKVRDAGLAALQVAL
jgi:hypothetical protein